MIGFKIIVFKKSLKTCTEHSRSIKVQDKKGSTQLSPLIKGRCPKDRGVRMRAKSHKIRCEIFIFCLQKIKIYMYSFKKNN